MSNYQELKKLGLSDKEAKIYYTSLSRGPETAPNLAKLAYVVRPTTYVIIEGLIKKGLMSSFEKGKKTFYVAESPEHLLSIIRLQKKEFEEREREFRYWLNEKRRYSDQLKGKLGTKSIEEINQEKIELTRKLRVEEDRLTQDLKTTTLSPEELVGLNSKVQNLEKAREKLKRDKERCVKHVTWNH